MDGKLADHKSGLYKVDNAGLEHSVLLKNHIQPFQKWKNEKQEIFLKHFGITDFDFSSLNPFSLGRINGGSPLYAWSGTGYYDLKLETPAFLPCLPSYGDYKIFIIKKLQ